MRKRVCKVATVILGIILVVDVLATINMEHRVAREIAAIKADGNPISFRDVLPKSFSDQENAAPLYEDIFKKYNEYNDPEKRISRFCRGNFKDPALFSATGEILAKNKSIIGDIEIAEKKPLCIFSPNQARIFLKRWIATFQNFTICETSPSFSAQTLFVAPGMEILRRPFVL